MNQNLIKFEPIIIMLYESINTSLDLYSILNTDEVSPKQLYIKIFSKKAFKRKPGLFLESFLLMIGFCSF